MVRKLLIAGMLLPALTWAEGTKPNPVVPGEEPAMPPTIVVLGDSLSAAYGIETAAGWVKLLDQRLAAAGLPHRVINASVSGDTTGAGLTRLPGVLERHRPDLVVIALGANDGLRGTATRQIADNLKRLVDLSRNAGAKSLLVGVRLPPNYGAAYTRGFQATLAGVAETSGVPLVTDLLAGVAEDRSLMQPDGLHPTAEAQPRLLQNVWDTLWAMLRPASPAPAP